MSASIQFVWVGFIKHFAQWKNEEGRAGQPANGTEIERKNQGNHVSTVCLWWVGDFVVIYLSTSQ